MPEKETFVDLFCGAGGIRPGMEEAGFRCVTSSDINAACRDTYHKNFYKMPLGDITKIDAAAIPAHDILCAGFPCQPFSISGKKKGFEDTRGTLFFEICRILYTKQPKIVLLENVKNLIYHDQGQTFSVILDSLADLGYHAEWRVLNASDFGVPQNRERVIIIASKKKRFDFDHIEMHPRVSLETFLDTEGDFTFLDPDEYTLIERPKLQPSGLIFAGYRNGSLRKVGVRPGTEHLSRTHRQPDRIYSASGIHPTLSSQETSGRYLILTQDGRVRKLTIGECWRLMGFPEDFIKTGSVTDQYRQLGNSVCVPMIAAIAKEIREQFFTSEPADIF